MGAPAKGSVVLVPFPFSDLSQAKLRPAIVMADAGYSEHAANALDVVIFSTNSSPPGRMSLLPDLCTPRFPAGISDDDWPPDCERERVLVIDQ